MLITNSSSYIQQTNCLGDIFCGQKPSDTSYFQGFEKGSLSGVSSGCLCLSKILKFLVNVKDANCDTSKYFG